MPTLELSSYLYEIPNYAYASINKILIGCSTLSLEYRELIGLYWKYMRRQLCYMCYMPAHG